MRVLAGGKDDSLNVKGAYLEVYCSRIWASTFMSVRVRPLAGRARQDRYPRALTRITRQIVSTRHW